MANCQIVIKYLLTMQFNVQDISIYRTHLMGIATLLVIFGHSAGNGVVMPDWMESLCGLASVGVDIFLLVSGFGMWYSLNNLKAECLSGGVLKQWYARRYKRVLVPYLIIIGFQYILSIIHGMPISHALLELSTIGYWINHQGAWFIAMLIPVYAITPFHYIICRKINPVLYSLMIIVFVVIVSALNYPIENSQGQMIIANIKHVIYHLPSFLIGFMLAPFALNNKKISFFWLILLPMAIVLLQKFMHFGYWPGFLVLPFITICCFLLHYASRVVSSILGFFGKISLESYLFNVIIGSWIIWYLPSIYESPLNKGCYLSYFIVCVVGTILAYIVNIICNRLLNHTYKY